MIINQGENILQTGTTLNQSEAVLILDDEATSIVHNKHYYPQFLALCFVHGMSAQFILHTTEKNVFKSHNA